VKKKLFFLILILFISIFLIWIIKNQSEGKLFEVMKIPDFELVSQDGQLISNEDLLGKVYVVEFFFTNCPTICPVMNQNLKEVEKEVNHPDFGVISITIDPKRDTPEVLKEHKQKLQIDNPNWHFLTGERDYIYQLCKEFNIYVGKDENTADGLDHSGKIALIDKEGKIRCRYDQNGIPILYYSGLNYTDERGKKESLGGAFHPQVKWLEEDIRKLLGE